MCDIGERYCETERTRRSVDSVGMTSRHSRVWRWVLTFSSVILASGTRQIDNTFVKGLPTIQVQELCKSHNKRKFRQQYHKSRFSGDKTAPLAVSFHHTWAAILDVFKNFAKSARIKNSYLVPLGCPFGRYHDLGTTVAHRSPAKMSAHALEKMTRDRFRAISLAPRQKCPRNVFDMKETMAAFLAVTALQFVATVRDQKLFWSKFWRNCVV